MALHAASRYGCRVTTTTISRAQYDLTVQRIHDAKLSDRVTVSLKDYRELTGSYDKLVSLEMIEAVGAEYFEAYFAQVGRLLAPHGLALIQAITIPDNRFAESVRRVGFVKRHIFPGGQLPSLDAMSTAWAKQTDLRLLHFEDFGTDYARTLREWRRRFHARLPEIEALGYPTRFQRMWDFYLAACEGSFLERQCGVAQLLLARPDARRAPLVPPLTTR
jgi:cyclopropane-fatty-acyl-phospholipid synthase